MGYNISVNQTSHLYSSLTPYAKTMSGNSSSIDFAHEFIRFNACSSLGFSNS